jgi:hypothetical protein
VGWRRRGRKGTCLGEIFRAVATIVVALEVQRLVYANVSCGLAEFVSLLEGVWTVEP